MGGTFWAKLARIVLYRYRTVLSCRRPYGTGGTGTERLQYWGPEELFRCGSIVVRREAGIGQFVLSGREERYGCCSKELLLSGNSIGKMVRGFFVPYVEFLTGLILRLAITSVNWHVLWCSWADISAFLIDEE